jgi:UPF0755 protein
MFDIRFEKVVPVVIQENLRKKGMLWWGMLALVPLLFGILVFLTDEPLKYPEHTLVSIPEGSSSTEVAGILKNAGLVFSEKSILSALFLEGGITKIQAGDYFFDIPESSLQIARRLIEGDYRLVAEAIVVPEGATVRDMALLFEKKFDGLFDLNEFIKKAQMYEGYLFPDTYFFFPNATADIVISSLRRNFDAKILKLTDEIEQFGKPLEEVVVMASLLEKEARELETRRMIAGVLWRRLEISMPLQVDAVFPYIIGKNTFEVTREDLLYDSPYNTYVYKGLPPGPIGSPSFESLLAAVTPIESEYLFYLADHDGVTHYAKTFEEHVANKRRYLR